MGDSIKIHFGEDLTERLTSQASSSKSFQTYNKD